MFSNYLSSIEGVATFPIISLIIFISLFVVVTIWVLRVDKKYIKEMKNMPLDDKEEISNKTENENENKK